jgi:hypothetical protein
VKRLPRSVRFIIGSVAVIVAVAIVPASFLIESGPMGFAGESIPRSPKPTGRMCPPLESTWSMAVISRSTPRRIRLRSLSVNSLTLEPLLIASDRALADCIIGANRNQLNLVVARSQSPAGAGRFLVAYMPERTPSLPAG